MTKSAILKNQRVDIYHFFVIYQKPIFQLGKLSYAIPKRNNRQ